MKLHTKVYEGPGFILLQSALPGLLSLIRKKSLLKYTFGNFYSFQRILPFYSIKLLAGVKKVLADVFILILTVMWFLHFPVPVTPIQVAGDCGNYYKDFILTVKLLLLCAGKIEHVVCALL